MASQNRGTQRKLRTIIKKLENLSEEFAKARYPMDIVFSKTLSGSKVLLEQYETELKNKSFNKKTKNKTNGKS